MVAKIFFCNAFLSQARPYDRLKTASVNRPQLVLEHAKPHFPLLLNKKTVFVG